MKRDGFKYKVQMEIWRVWEIKDGGLSTLLFYMYVTTLKFISPLSFLTLFPRLPLPFNVPNVFYMWAMAIISVFMWSSAYLCSPTIFVVDWSSCVPVTPLFHFGLYLSASCGWPVHFVYQLHLSFFSLYLYFYLFINLFITILQSLFILILISKIS